MVAREKELAVLEGALGQLGPTGGRLIIISGEAGIGKSALARTGLERALARGFDTGIGYGVLDVGAPALWPWVRAGRHLARVRGALQHEHTADLEPAARFRLFEAVSEALAADAAERGLVLLLEDMQWADSLSVLLLRHLSLDLAGMRVLILATSRSTWTEGLWAATVPELLRSGASLVPLRGLTSPDVARWMQVSAGDWTAYAPALARNTGGNPFLIELVTSGTAPVPGPDPLRAMLSDRADLRTLITARVNSLAPEFRGLIEIAAVMAERIQPTLLARIAGSSVEHVSEQLGVAAATGILQFGDRGLTFAHALVRDAIVAAVDPERLAELHTVVARALATDANEGITGVIAEHWRLANDPDAARHCLDYARRAARHAGESLAYEQAAAFATMAVDQARALGGADAVLAELMIQLAEYRAEANQLTEALATLTEASDIAERAGRPDLLARAALVLHGVGSFETHRVILDICDRALAQLATPDPVIESRLLAQQAVCAAECGGGAHAADLAATALAKAAAAGDPLAELEAVAARHLAIAVPQTVTERKALALRAVSLSHRVGSPVAALWGHLWTFETALQTGDMATVDVELGEIDQISRRSRSPIARWHHLRLSATRTTLVGDFAAGLAAIAEAQRIAVRMQDLSMMGQYYAYHLQLALLRNDLADLPPEFLTAVNRSPAIPVVRLCVPLLYALRGDHDRSRAAFAEFRRLPEGLPYGPRWAPTLVLTGQAAIMLADKEVAARVYRALRPTAEYCTGDGSGAVFAAGSNALLLADLALTIGDHAAAAEWYATAYQVNTRLGARPFAALAVLGLAEAAAAQVAHRDAGARAHDLSTLRRDTARAAEEFRRLGMLGSLAQAEAALSMLSKGADKAGCLSRREKEVTALVARALSNRDIALQLHLSERTVESHVSHILTKLSLRTRTELTAWYLRD